MGVHFWNRGMREQRTARGAGHVRKNLIPIPEADFGFGRVDVDIYHLRRELEKEHRHREPPDHEQGVVGLHEGRCQGRILHPPSIDEKGDFSPVGTGEAGRANVSGQAEMLVNSIDFEHLPGNFGAVENAQDFAAVACAGGLQGEAAFLLEAKTGMGVGNGVTGDEGVDLAAFGEVGFEEFEPCGDVVKQVFDADDRALRRTDCFERGGVSCGDFDPCPRRLAGNRGRKREVRNGTDGGQRFPAKAEGDDVEEVIRAGEFAGGVAFDGEGKFSRGDALPVVGKFDQFFACAFDRDGEVARARVQRVFKKFFDDGRGPFNHFTGGDLGGDFGGEDADGHGGRLEIRDG